MKKKLLSIAAACVLGVQAIAMPMIANAEQGTHYVEKSDFNDVSIGGAKGTGYYGLGIIMDGSPWLSKGSASVHYQTFYHDDQRNVNYCNFWSNSDKTGSGDGEVQCISTTETLLKQWDLTVLLNMTFV